jgi:hypothetical protein
VLALVVAMVVAGLSVAMLNRTTHEVTASGLQAERESAYQAAQAGSDDYIARMTTDHLYFQNRVHPAESARKYSTATLYPAGSAVAGLGTVWTYPAHRTGYVELSNGYRYSLEVKAPSTATYGGTVVTVTGYRASNPRSYRTIEVVFKASSIADYQMYSDAAVAYGNTAVTTGKVFSRGTVNHDGAALNSVFSAVNNGVMPMTSTTSCSKTYATTTGPCIIQGTTAVIAWPKAAPGDPDTAQTSAFAKEFPEGAPSFDSFNGPTNDAQRATLTLAGPTQYYLPSIYNTASPPAIDITKAYGLQFLSISGVGYVRVWICTQYPTTSSGYAKPAGLADGVAAQRPTCVADPGRPGNLPMPPNGAIYSAQSVLVWGTVNGQVTVVSEADAILGEPAWPSAPAASAVVLKYNDTVDDVIGIVAKRDLLIPEWGPSTATITASGIAQNGQFRQGCIAPYAVPATITGWGYNKNVPTKACVTSLGSITFNMSVATKMGGSMSGLYPGGRTYNYDDNLQIRVPPYFPVIDSSYTIIRFREITTP